MLKSVKTSNLSRIKRYVMSRRRKSSNELKNTNKWEEKLKVKISPNSKQVSKGTWEFETDEQETIIVQLSRLVSDSNDYTLFFRKKDDNIPFWKQPQLSFFIESPEHIYISHVSSGNYHNIGWCSLMIQVLMELLEKWREDSELDIQHISIVNQSLRKNNGNIAGTICYIKNIGKYYPFFITKYSNNYHNLSKYFLLKSWENILPKIDINIFQKNKKWSGEGTYHFFKNIPVVKPILSEKEDFDF